LKAIVLTSNKVRHKYYVQQISKYFNVVGVISEPKIKYYNKVFDQSAKVREHFKKLEEYEVKYLNNLTFPKKIDVLELSKDKLNSEEVVNFAKSKKPDVIFLFGTGILNQVWLEAFPNKIINFHLGLSPYYRGSATLFWPIYNGQYNCIGVTVHIAAKKVDAGAIIARIKPSLEIGDNYYDINLKAIKKGIDLMPQIVIDYFNGNKDTISQNLKISKLYKKSDFTEEKLNSVLEKLKKGITTEIIEGIKTSKECNC
jgi:methionyl-tRNA formyltransferase